MTQLLRRHLPMLATLFTFLLLVLVASLRYDGFFSVGVFTNLLDDNAFLGVAAIGMTFVILAGGIDLSVGSIIALASISLSMLVEKAAMNPGWAIVLVLAGGAVFGAAQGALIWFFALPAFLVTLAGMFFARGLAYTVSLESVQFTHPLYAAISGMRLPIGKGYSVTAMAVLFGFVVLTMSYVSKFTRFGRSTYAVGGNVQSAVLMGLPVARTSIGVYLLSGFFSALAGVVYSFYTSSGNASTGIGLELEAIAAVVIGGTLLKGGSGSVLGTWIGVLILGVIQTIVTFENALNSWWTKIAIGVLLFAFIVLQRLVSGHLSENRPAQN